MKRMWRTLTVVMLLAATTLGQTALIVPGDNLVVEGVPQIPATLADEVRRYTEFRSASLSGWHPTRREILISTRFGDTAQVHHVKMPGGDRTQLTFFPERVAGASFRPKTGEYFVFSKDIGGSEFFQLFRQDVATGNVTMLTDGKSRNTGGVWSNAGDRAVYGSTRRNGKDNDLYIINPADPQTNRLLLQVEGGGWGAAEWSPDDKQILVEEFISANESYIWLADAATGEKTLFTPKGGAGKNRLRFFGLQQGRQGALRHDRQGLGVPAARLR